MLSCAYEFTFPLRDSLMECKADKILSFFTFFPHLRFKDYAHCCIALKILEGMKAIICFWVTSQLCWFCRPHRHPWNKKWDGVPFYPCLPVNMLKNLPNDRTTLFRRSDNSEAKQPKCRVKSQSVFLSHIWRNAATCLPVPSPSLPVPQWLVYWNLVYPAHHTSHVLTSHVCAHAVSNHTARQLNRV